ncbi:wings apart-like protein regulation of heterochromatin-domain-containing protein [Xylaria palmicola]|nr:wings apart-like protein regulation of heterochromatin-domain-containing protein [Xylaria palmicola]
MGTDLETGAQRKRRMVTTYGKAARRRQPKAVFNPVTASECLSEEDPITASGVTAEGYRPPVPSPQARSPLLQFKNLDRTWDTQNSPEPKSDRKRKISQISKPKDRSQPAINASEEGTASAPKVHQSRIAQPRNRPAAKSGVRARAHAQKDMQEDSPRASSPPPTPTPTRQKSTDVLAVENARKQPVRQQQQQIPLHLARGAALKAEPSNVLSPRALKDQSNRAPQKSRKRLIDVLVEQEGDTEEASSQIMPSQSSSVSEPDNQSEPVTPKGKTRTAPAIRTFSRSSSALKFTYGQGRTVREEEDNLLESLVLPEEPSHSRRRLELGNLKKSTSGAFDYDDDEGTTNNSPSSKLRGIHELRQAGANSRVADAMQDLIDQIGEPGTSASSRRAALLQVAEKLRDKTFIRQCRDHGVESVMLKDIGKETDIICSFLILSSLVTIIARGPSAHIGRLLTEGAGPMFARLLSAGEDIKKVAKDRKSNLSKRSQNAIAGIGNLLRELPIWDGGQPSFISPRSLAIKCLQLLITQSVLIGGDPTIFTEPVTENLFQVLSDASSNTECWEYPKTTQSVELYGALSVLDAYAVNVATTQSANNEWATQHLPIIADVFYTSLQTPANDGKAVEVEDLILKLTINVTNNNLAAPGVFASKGLLPALAASISQNFNQALTLIARDAWAEGILDSLVLRLGILINFAEHSGLVRQIVNDCQHDSREPVKELIQLFIENHRRTGEADSMEKTHLNVAFGYLSVLLGYLSLHAPVRQKLKSSHSAKSIGPLIGAIREFLAHYEQVENVLSESDDEDRRGSYAERLQELVQHLEEKAAHD